MRHPARRRDLEPQRIGNLPLQRMLGHRRAAIRSVCASSQSTCRLFWGYTSEAPPVDPTSGASDHMAETGTAIWLRLA
jgi:hypothetical protein